ncbi:MAG: abortive infection family protein [Armatimonadota bacterium]
MARDIVSKATRAEFREWLVGFYLREIEDIFNAAGVECDSDYEPCISGMRRSLVEQYYHSVDWTNWKQVQPVLDAYEQIMIHMPEDKRGNCEKLLLRDGLQFDGIRIARVQNRVVAEDKLQQIADSLELAIINEQVARLRGAIEDDPALAIGTAKELLESVCRGIAHECGHVLNGKEDIPSLVKLCLKSLRMAREDIEESKKGADARKQIASGLAAACQGITELRNVYGTGHGRGPNAVSAVTRDARLAVGTATTLGVFLAEVCEARRGLINSNA